MQDYPNLVYQNGMISTIKKPARFTKNTFVSRTFNSSIFTSDVSYHFLVIFLIPSVKLLNEDEISWIYKRFVTDQAIAFFRTTLHQNNWKEF